MPALWAALAFCFGIGFASAVGWPALLSWLVLALFPKWPRLALYGAFFPAGALAWVAGNARMPDSIEAFRNTNALVVAEALDTNLIRVVQLAEDEARPCSGVLFYRGRWLSRRDRFLISGHIDSSGVFRAVRTVRTPRFPVFSGIRNWVSRELLLWTFGPENYGLSLGFILGDRSKIPKELLSAFRSTGLMHLLAISGLHIGLVFLVIFVGMSLVRIPKKQALLISSGLIWLYTVFVGAPASAIRASLLITGFALGFAVVRKVNPLNILGAACLATLVINPNWLFDLGFQMSYAATFGILFYTRGLSGIMTGSWFKKWVVAPLIITFSAQVFVGPLLLKHFGTLSMWAFPLNVLAVPVLFWVIAQWILFFLGLPLHLGSSFAACANAGLDLLRWLVYSAANLASLSIGVQEMPWAAAWVWWGLALAAKPIAHLLIRNRLPDGFEAKF